MAVGIISTTEGTAPGFSATWDFLSVVEEIAPVLVPIEDVFLLGGSTRDIELQASDSDGGNIDFSFVGLPSFASFIDQGSGRGILRLTPTDNQTGTYSVTVTAMDGVSGRLSDDETFTISVLAPAAVIHRVNAGGGAISGSSAWEGDTSTAPATYSNAAGAFSMTWSSSAVVDMASPTIPAGTPAAVFQTHRFDRLWGQEMSW
ncbi:MAG: putative Ig domain-containing protein, partial [Pirellulaceae bacterium]